MPLCEKCQCELESFHEIPKVRIGLVVAMASHYFQLPKEMIIGPSRLRTYVSVRHIIMYYLYNNRHKLMDIGKHFSKDHSSVIHARTSVESRFFCDANEKVDYEKFCVFIRENHEKFPELKEAV